MASSGSRSYGKPSSVHGFDAPHGTDKMQSSTLKRQPSPEWSKTDLLRLLSHFEGELQARDISIATLKAEKAKQLLYQAKYGRFGIGDPFVALQRDAEGKNDTGFDESAIKSMYDNQLAQLENLIATQRKAQLKMREQLGNSEKRFHKVCSELEEEKQKHAQDTAQGDDVTYMLEKERERLKAEIDFEKSQNKKLEKDLKKTLAGLEEEKTNAARHKQVAIMLIKERKHLIENIIAENKLRDEAESALHSEKSKTVNMAEGLAQESKKSLKMEMAMEKQHSDFDSERDSLRRKLYEEELQTKSLRSEVARLAKQLEAMQMKNSTSTSSNVHMRSSVSPARTINPAPAKTTDRVSPSYSNPTQVQSCVVDSSSLHDDVLTVCSPSSSFPFTNTTSESPTLEFLGPEMANLHQLLASMMTDDKSPSSTHIPTTSTPESSTIGVSSQLSVNTSPYLSTQDSTTKMIRPNPSPTRSPVIVKKQKNVNNNNNDTIYNQDLQKNNYLPFDISASTTATVSVVHPIQITSQSNSNTRLQISSMNPNPKQTTVPTSSLYSNMSGTISPSSATPVALVEMPQINSKSIPSSISSSQNVNSQSDLNKIVNNSVSPTPSTLTMPQTYAMNQPISTNSVNNNIESSPVSTGQNLVPGFPLVRPTPMSLVEKSLAHRLTVQGDIQALHDCLKNQGVGSVNQALVDGTTPLHCAVEFNQEACVKLMLENSAKPSCLRDDRITPLHLAAAKGYLGCVRLLLSKGAAVNISALGNQTPLHLAVKGVHLECCQLLLRHGANVLYTGQDGLTSLHYACQACQPEILQVLLDRLKLNGTSRDSDAAHHLVAITDDHGWSIAHMAAHQPTQECLIKLAESLPLDFSVEDKQGRNVREVSSPTCQYLLADIDKPSSPSLKVQVELHYYLAHSFVSSAQISILDINPGISWAVMEERLRTSLKSYLAQLDVGLKTRRINRLDLDMNWLDKDFTLGLTMNNIKHFEMGFYTWTPGMQTDTSPYLILCNNEHKRVTIIVDDTTNMCDLIAFDILHPVSSVSNYLRLLEQYKSVIFYGPTGCGKSYLAHRLAQWIAAQENSKGKKPSIYQLSLNPGFTASKFLTFLKQRGCVVPVRKDPDNQVPILLLDNLETVDIARLFGELLDPIEYRGIGHAFCLRDDEQASGMHYFQDNFYVIGTMNKTRSLGVDLSVLPRFRWIQFRLDTEPLRGLLARHFLRRLLNLNKGCLPSQEEAVFRAVEWIVCVWQRLNDSLIKLGLPDVIMGPCSFFKCPLEKQDVGLILDWIKNVWNQQVAPQVREAVKKGTGSEAPSDGQQKVANTALYVLMQRSVILGCPLVGQAKESYLSGFCGSNELDIPLKAGDGRVKPASTSVMGRGTTSSTQQSGRVQGANDGANGLKTDKTDEDSESMERNGRGQVRNFFIGTSNIKRRSQSESSVNKAAQLEDQQQQQQHYHELEPQNLQLTTMDTNRNVLLSQAKVARLEVKSPKLLTIPATLRSSVPSKSSSKGSSPSLTQPPKKTGRMSPLFTSSPDKIRSSSLSSSSSSTSPKKSRSSENISSSGLNHGFPNRIKLTSPFSFSLATPTSKLSSFKVFDSSTTGDGGNDSTLLQEMPDFSIFNRVSTPTEDLPKSRGFVFGGTQRDNSDGANNNNNNVEKMSEEEEVWSRREDVFVPISTTGAQLHRGRHV